MGVRTRGVCRLRLHPAYHSEPVDEEEKAAEDIAAPIHDKSRRMSNENDQRKATQQVPVLPLALGHERACRLGIGEIVVFGLAATQNHFS
jgi:hypothetical protein